jgi:hypothetical protein
MLCKMTHKQEVAVEEEVDIQFPLFRKHECDGDGWMVAYITRVDFTGETFVGGSPKLREVEISRHSDYRSGTAKWEIEINNRAEFAAINGKDWNLCLGEHKGTAAEFLEALTEIEKELAKAREGVG